MKIPLYFSFILFLIGCEPQPNNTTRLGQNITEVYFPYSSNVNIQTVELDGHKYYVTSPHGSLTHSESCPCKQKAEKQ